MNYPEALRYLDRLVNREATAGRIHGLSLDSMRALVDGMANPQNDLRTIHVTGTNGKGSVVSMVGSLLMAAGLRVGCYLSPHVDIVRERIALNGEMISEEAFADLVGDVAFYVHEANQEPSYFEFLTAAALLWFSNEAVEVAVVEVGLLGRFDATNVIDAEVAVVTNVGRDHTDGVGDWQRAIAEEKAGIITENNPLILGKVSPDVRDLFVAEKPDPLYSLNGEFNITSTQVAIGGQVVGFQTPSGCYEDVFIPLYGSHQAVNAALALTAVEAFLGNPLELDVVTEGFRSVELPGRLEVLSRHPLVLADGAHNQDSARYLAEGVLEAFPVENCVLVLGVLEPHKPSEILDELLKLNPEVVITCTAPSERAISGDNLASIALDLGLQVEVVQDPSEAVERAISISRENDLVLVTGSFYIVTPARHTVSLFKRDF